jgi:hypothetical protein
MITAISDDACLRVTPGLSRPKTPKSESTRFSQSLSTLVKSLKAIDLAALSFLGYGLSWKLDGNEIDGCHLV